MKTVSYYFPNFNSVTPIIAYTIFLLLFEKGGTSSFYPWTYMNRFVTINACFQFNFLRSSCSDH